MPDEKADMLNRGRVLQLLGSICYTHGNELVTGSELLAGSLRPLPHISTHLNIGPFYDQRRLHSSNVNRLRGTSPSTHSSLHSS